MNINCKEAVKQIPDEFALVSAPPFVACPHLKIVSLKTFLVPQTEIMSREKTLDIKEVIHCYSEK